MSKETKIHGLVLAGGKSIRMGHDKSVINWHGKEQRYYIADLLEKFCDELDVFIDPEVLSAVEPFFEGVRGSRQEA